MTDSFWSACTQALLECRRDNTDEILRLLNIASRSIDLRSFSEKCLSSRMAYLEKLKAYCRIEIELENRDDKRVASNLYSKLDGYDTTSIRLTEKLRSIPSIDPLCLSDPSHSTLECEQEKADFGIIVFGHTRLDTLEVLLESLGRQNALGCTEVWLDGYQGKHDLRLRVEKAVDLVHRYPVRRLRNQKGHFGFRKMLILGLIEMTKKYKDILILEDDCFPTRNAVAEFKQEIERVRHDDKIFSVYGHHFLVESELATCPRFQGWGWATTSEKLTPILRQLIDCYSMTEERYLEFVNMMMTPEIVSRIDVTPPRQPSITLEKFFAWDETICLLSALNNQVHKPTRTRTIYNCGMGDDSAHFADNSIFRKPPFNMIKPNEVWNYF